MTPYLNIFLKYFSHPCFFEKNHIFFALLVYVCRKKTPKTNPCLIFLQKTDSSVRCILIIIIISYVFYINTHLSMITVHEAIYFYVFQCLDAEYQCFLTGLIISVWTVKFLHGSHVLGFFSGFKQRSCLPVVMYMWCNVQADKGQTSTKILKIFHVSFKRGSMQLSQHCIFSVHVCCNILTPSLTNFHKNFKNI